MNKQEVTALVPVGLNETKDMATTLSKSLLVPDAFKNKPSDAFMAICYGRELGLPPVSSLKSIAVIKGKPTLYANAMVGLVLSSGAAEYFMAKECNATSATYETKRKGAPEAQSTTFTIEDAKKADLLKSDAWKKYPENMLRARAKAFLARDVYPDILHGIHSAEEVQDFSEPNVAVDTEYAAPAPGAAKVEGEIVEKQVSAHDLGMRLLEATTSEELANIKNEILPDIEKLSGSDKVQLRELYTSHNTRLIQKENG